jgi:hypothetical protein
VSAPPDRGLALYRTALAEGTLAISRCGAYLPRVQPTTTRHLDEIWIARPAVEVFRFITTPAEWPRVHPASRRTVDGATARPARLGESFTESYRAGGRLRTLRWTVTAEEPPVHWAVTGQSLTGDGISTALSYRFREERGGTVFTRELRYTLTSSLLILLNRFVLAPRLCRESRASLQRLKQLLEAIVPWRALPP